MMKKSNELSAITELLERSAPVYAATVGLDGRPQLRPVCFLFQQDGALYFLTAKSRRLYAELCKSPNIQLCVSDHETETCLRISGKVCFTEDPDLILRCIRERPAAAAAMGGDQKALIAFFLMAVRAERSASYEEAPLEAWTLPDPSGVPVGITIKKKPSCGIGLRGFWNAGKQSLRPLQMSSQSSATARCSSSRRRQRSYGPGWISGPSSGLPCLKPGISGSTTQSWRRRSSAMPSSTSRRI